jgi:hypothetical protein
VSPAARLKHARHALAGLLVPATWFALTGSAAGEEAPTTTTTTTTAAPATTTTTAPPPTTTTIPAKYQERIDEARATQAAWAPYVGEDESEAPAPAEAAGAGVPVESVGTDDPIPSVIAVDDEWLPATAPRTLRLAPTATDAAAPAAASTESTPSELPSTDDTGAPAPTTPSGGSAQVVAPSSGSFAGWGDAFSGLPASLADLAASAVAGQQLPAPLTLGPSATGQAENPERGPPGGSADISTGDAIATGNAAVTTINQTTLVAVTDKGTVSLTTVKNPDTGEGWMSASLPSSMFDGDAAPALAMVTGYGEADGTAVITTGDAIATGNQSTTIINQKVLAAVTADGADLVVNQPASVANVGTATAVTGANTALGTSGDGTGSTVINTGAATAVGNRSTTIINQKSLVAVTGSGSTVSVVQSADVDNIGTATAITGDNTATGSGGEGDGSAVIHTGDAVAFGNISSTTIHQTATAAVVGDGSNASIDQQATVDNIGTATASTGGNAAVATAGGESGSVLITTGDAAATGNVADTTITQDGIRIATGRFAGVSVTQDAIVANIGTATATTGRNTGVGVG